MIYIGIDPGKSGAYAIITPDCVLVKPWDNVRFIADMSCAQDYACIACVEKVGAMPKQGVTSTFTFGKAAGYIEGVLEAYEIPYQLVTPKTWKKEYGLGSDKKQSIEVCKRLFPNVSLKRTEKCMKDHDGMAEALLMAEYARRRM